MDTVIKLVITLNPAGQVLVEGPIENKLLAYGLLEIARDVVDATCKAMESRVVPATDSQMAALALVKKGS